MLFGSGWRSVPGSMIEDSRVGRGGRGGSNGPKPPSTASIETLVLAAAGGGGHTVGGGQGAGGAAATTGFEAGAPGSGEAATQGGGAACWQAARTRRIKKRITRSNIRWPATSYSSRRSRRREHATTWPAG